MIKQASVGSVVDTAILVCVYVNFPGYILTFPHTSHNFPSQSLKKRGGKCLLVPQRRYGPDFVERSTNLNVQACFRFNKVDGVEFNFVASVYRALMSSSTLLHDVIMMTSYDVIQCLRVY